MKVVIVGAGLSGLSAACHLAKSGHDITVVESEEHPGGRSGVVGEPQYVIDNGPTVMTMTNLVRDAVMATGARMGDYLDLLPVEPAYRAIFSDGKTFDGDGELFVRTDSAGMYEEIRAACGLHDAEAYLRFVKYLRRLYEAEFPNFIDRNFSSVLSLAKPLGAGLSLLRLRAFSKLDTVVGEYFQDERLRKIFSFQALYAGLSPLESLAVYAIITYMDSVEGVWFPRGGMNRIPHALAQAAAAAGVKFEYGTSATRFGFDSGRAPSSIREVVLSDGRRLEADAVVATMDMPMLYRDLLRDFSEPALLRSGEYSPSAYLMLLGVKGAPPHPSSHHNIFFGKQWKESFDSLLRRGEIMKDPSILVSVPTETDPSLAPPGHSIFYVLEPVPNLGGRLDWDIERPRLRSALLERMHSWGYLSSESEILHETIYDPVDWLSKGMAQGTPFSLSHRFLQSGPFRPANLHSQLRNLALAGSATVPGVGVPMVLISGKLAAQRVLDMAASL